MLVLILDMQPLCLKDEAKSIDDVMIYFPHYALASGLKNIYSSYEYNEICDFLKNGESEIKIVVIDIRPSECNKKTSSIRVTSRLFAE